MSATEAPRLTPTQRLHEVTMASLTREARPPESSVSLTRNARGVTQIDVTVRAEAADEAEKQAREIYERLRNRYPLPSGFVDAKGESK